MISLFERVILAGRFARESMESQKRETIVPTRNESPSGNIVKPAAGALLISSSLLLCIMTFSVSLPDALADDLLHQLGLKFRASFDSSVSDMWPRDAFIEAHGGRLVEDGISGSALRLEKGEVLVLDAQKAIGSSPESTLMLWVRPRWDYFETEGGQLVSHTFLSFAWDDPSRSYFALSDGWWEPLGSPYSYAVFSNRDNAHLKSRISFGVGKWVLMALTWQTGAKGTLALHVNGELASTWGAGPLRNLAPEKMLYLGSDGGTPLRQERWADCDFDELLAFSKKLSDDEITAVMRLKDPQWELHTRPWLAELPWLPYAPARDSAGVILEARAIFDEGTGWMTEAGARKTLSKIREAGFNMYVPCVWHGKGTRYPSRLAESEPGLYFSGEDPLSRLIRLAHAEGIEVHPWFCVSLRERNFLRTYYDAGTPPKAFDLHKAQFRKFIVNLMLDVVKRYEVDGVNLDYIRTQGICTSESCRRDYSRFCGRDLDSDLKQRRPNGSLEAHVQEWQDQAVQAIVQDFSTNGKALRSKLIVSVDGHPIPTSIALPPNEEGRQEIKWASNGLVDVVFAMEYSQNPDFGTFAAVRDELKTNGRMGCLLFGNYDANGGKVVSRSANIVANLLSYAHNRWAGGVGLYIYSRLDDSQVEALQEGPFSSMAKTPWGATNVGLEQRPSNPSNVRGLRMPQDLLE